MQTPSKSMLIIMGICIGLIFFGINIALINFNRLVVPEQPLALLNWRTAGEELKISLLGETLCLPLDSGAWLESVRPQKVGEQTGKLYRLCRDEISYRLAPVQQKLLETIGWP